MATKAVVVSRRSPVRTRIIRVGPRARKLGANLPTFPVAVLAGMAPIAMSTYNEFRFNGATKAGNHLIKKLSGFDIPGKAWRFREMYDGLLPIIAGMAVHKVVGGYMGVNRLLARAGVPLIRI